jgi:IclR family acetate operon transcriptional repressor
VQLETWLHQAYPLHLTAAGKALLAYAGEASIRAYLKQPLLAYTSKSMTDPDLLKQDLAATRLRGYAETQQEFSDEISSFAVGLFDRDQIVASISISIPVFRFPADGGQTMVQLLKETANLIQSHMRKEEKSGLAA